jgi:transposase
LPLDSTLQFYEAFATKYNHINIERYNGGMKRIQVPSLTKEQLTELEELYQKTNKPRYRTRAQMVLLSAEKGLKAEEIAQIVRESHITVLRWLKRYLAEGVEGLQDAPRPGRSSTVTEAYRKQLLESVRRRPRSLGLEYSMWTLQRLSDYMAEETGLRLSYETIRRELAKEGIVFSRPQHTISSPDPEYQVKKKRLKVSETS